MNKIMGVVVGIIGIAVVMAVFPIVTDSTDSVMTDQTTEAFAAVATGVGETAADIVLSADLYGDRTASVISVTSDNIADTPAAGTYTSATNTLNVTGLAESDTRALTATYKIDALDDYTGLSQIASITPLLIWVTIIVVLLGSIGAVFKGRS